MGSATMRDLIADLPEQLRQSAGLVGLAELVAPKQPPRSVVLAGMGGSAIAGDLARPLLTTTRLEVRRDYGLPSWAGTEDLVVVSSYSGNTEESLSVWHEASERGCPRLVQTSGGLLQDLAAAAGVPAVVLPSGLPPRASLGYGLGALVRILGRLGCLADADTELAGAAAELERLGADRLAVDAAPTDAAGNPHPARVAADLVGGLAVVHTAGDEAHGAGLRLGAQLNENGKVPVQLGAYPELDHNQLVGWADVCPQRGGPVLVLLRSACLDPATELRTEVTGDLLAPAFRARHTVTATGAGTLARILSLVQWGDALSWHLARLRGVDPVPVDRIEDLKRALASGRDDANRE